jgi:hypothetical protein
MYKIRLILSMLFIPLVLWQHRNMNKNKTSKSEEEEGYERYVRYCQKIDVAPAPILWWKYYRTFL